MDLERLKRELLDLIPKDEIIDMENSEIPDSYTGPLDLDHLADKQLRIIQTLQSNVENSINDPSDLLGYSQALFLNVQVLDHLRAEVVLEELNSESEGDGSFY